MDRPTENDLVEGLHPVRAKWRSLGIALKMTKNDLDAIENTVKGDVERALQDMLGQWLRSDEVRTWQQIIEALQSSVVAQNMLAKTLQDKHCPDYVLESGATRSTDSDREATVEDSGGGASYEMERSQKEGAILVSEPDASLLSNYGQPNDGGPTTSTSNQNPENSKFIKIFLRYAGFGMIGLAIPLAVIGIFMLVVSIQGFSGEWKCEGVGIKYSLSFFIYLFALLCFGGPALLVLFCLYFKFEDPKTKWKNKYRITRCVAKAQTVVFLIVFILVVFELLYSLLYIIPEVITNYSEWQKTRRNDTESICDDRIYLTSLSIVTVGYSVIFILLVVLGVFLANHYFKWIRDEKDPGVIIKVVYACLGREFGQDAEQ